VEVLIIQEFKRGYRGLGKVNSKQARPSKLITPLSAAHSVANFQLLHYYN